MSVTQRRTTGDFAHQMRWLVDEAYTDVPVVRVVLDNLNTHVISRSCLRKCLPDEESLCREIQALELERNQAKARINWRFNIIDARAKLHRLYPINS